MLNKLLKNKISINDFLFIFQDISKYYKTILSFIFDIIKHKNKQITFHKIHSPTKKKNICCRRNLTLVLL
jgi:hypothetical protein